MLSAYGIANGVAGFILNQLVTIVRVALQGIVLAVSDGL